MLRWILKSSFPLLAAFLALSCAEPVEIIVPAEEEYATSGSAAIDSRITDDLRMGFRFALADTIYYPNSNMIYPDVCLRVSSGGNTLEFFAVEVRPAFKMVYSCSTVDSAEMYFDSLEAVTDTTGFVYYGANVAANQVWLVKTNASRYAKIMVRTAVIDTVGKAVFDWVYQPSGTLVFPTE